ncbi:hypothetical protein [Glycomyces niveus]|uniref:Uncharacterized protein n=1 Tax=Glycomyces niveus TaxID=2820287 RepID=A0ABS3UAD8_9ACTN|nr:hypothetical protein [Glycomyces sp. NEAU-S30]MBO3735745.1 hypothetical protein [Glycomyces sp. NEAU-S30]
MEQAHEVGRLQREDRRVVAELGVADLEALGALAGFAAVAVSTSPVNRRSITTKEEAQGG